MYGSNACVEVVVQADGCTVSIAGVTITNSRGHNVLRVAPTGSPASGFKVQKETDDAPIDYVQVGIPSRQETILPG